MHVYSENWQCFRTALRTVFRVGVRMAVYSIWKHVSLATSFIGHRQLVMLWWKFSFSNRVVNTWNNLPNWVVIQPTKCILDQWLSMHPPSGILTGVSRWWEINFRTLLTSLLPSPSLPLFPFPIPPYSLPIRPYSLPMPPYALPVPLSLYSLP